MFEDDEHTMMVPTFSAGTFFADRYRIDDLLGAGAMGRVYRAFEMATERYVALKVLHSDRLVDAETVARFAREAEVLASIGHPAIVQIFAFHRSAEGIPYLAMELLEGTSLKARLQDRRFEDPLELQETVVDTIAGALDAAHAAGVVHRDLKPDNVFILERGEPRAKLVDFGLSRIQRADKSLTHSGMILGTPRYMPPEQIRDASESGPRGDLYSFGVILYEALSGKSPYPAADYGQLLGCLLEGRITRFEEVRPDLPRLGPFMARALARDPSARFASAGELADAFGEAVGRPSRRGEIRALPAPAPTAARPSPALSMSHGGSTLAFDPAAGAKLIAELEAKKADYATTAPTPPPVEDTLRTGRSDTNGVLTPPPPSDSHALPPAPPPAVASASVVAVGRPLAAHGAPAPARAMPSPYPSPAPYGAAPPYPAHAMSPAPQGALPSAPSSVPATPAQLPPVPPELLATPQGGGTLALPSYPPPSDGGPAPSFSTPAPQSFSDPPPAGPAPAAFTSAAPPMSSAAPAPRRRWGLIIFGCALIVVIAVSAVGGFLLRTMLAGR